jgi:hypothetical protein
LAVFFRLTAGLPTAAELLKWTLTKQFPTFPVKSFVLRVLGGRSFDLHFPARHPAPQARRR